MIIKIDNTYKVIACYHGEFATKFPADGVTFFEVEDVPECQPNTIMHFDPQSKEFYTAAIDPAIIAERKAKAEAAKYPALVERYLRERYTLSAELAILRQRDSKPDEFAAYNAYAEECKARAKAELNR
jgi:hypothetical protein